MGCVRSIVFCLLLSATLVFSQGPGNSYRIDIVAGATGVGDGGPATQAVLRSPGGLAVDSSGAIYLADMGSHRIRRIDAAGVISTVAGTGNRGVNGDEGPADQAELWSPRSVVAGPDGALYLADGSTRIRRVDPDGRINTIAGNGKNGWSGDGGPATLASIGIPIGLVLDPAGNLFFSDVLWSVVRKVSPDGRISTVAGTGTAGFGGDDGPATHAQLFAPLGLAFNSTGNLLIADYGNLRVREVLGNGSIRTVTGGGRAADGGPSTEAFLSYPCAIASGPRGNIYVGEVGGRIRRIDAAGIITTIASADAAEEGAARVRLEAGSSPCGLAMDGHGDLLVSDAGNHRVWRISVSVPQPDAVPVAGRLRERSRRLPALNSNLFLPEGAAVGPDGTLYFADIEDNRVYQLVAPDVLTVLAGTGAEGNSGDGGPAFAATLRAPSSVSVDSAGNVWIADSLNQSIRKVSPDGVITTAASQNAPEARNRLVQPVELAADNAGNVYFIESNQHAVRKLAADGNITVFAGSTEAGFGGDGGSAVEAKLNAPQGLAVDSAGNVYIADSLNHAVRRVGVDGKIETVAGRGQSSADGVKATSAALFNPVRVAVDKAGDLLIGEALSAPVAGLVRRVDTAGVIATIAGNGAGGLAGDGGLATRATLGSVLGLAVDGSNNIFIADGLNRIVRKLSHIDAAKLVMVSGNGQHGSVQSTLPEPLAVAAMDSSGIPVPGIRVQFTITDGLATLPLDEVLTASDGVALARVTLGASPGAVHVSAHADGLGSLTFDLRSESTVAPEAPVLRDYTIRTMAGNAEAGALRGGYFADPVGLAFDSRDQIYVADRGNHTVQRVDAAGELSTLAGSGKPGFGGDTEPALAATLNSPAGVAVDANGAIYIADRANHRIRRIDSAGRIDTIAGTGTAGFSGDGGPAIDARLSLPSAVAVGKDGSIYFSDTGNRRVRRIRVDGVIKTVAGNGEFGGGKDGDFAERFPLVAPAGLAIGSEDVLFIADQGAHLVFAVSREGVTKTLAGIGRPPTADEERSTDLPAALDSPAGLAVDREGTLYIGEKGRIRSLRPNGAAATVGKWDWGGVLWPALNREGVLHVLDTQNGVVQRLEKDGSLTAVAGSRFAGDGGPAEMAALSSPEGVVLDSFGQIYFVDSKNHRIRRIGLDGAIETVAGTGRAASSGDGGPARKASLDIPTGLAIHPDGSLYVAEYRGARIRRIAPDGVIRTIAGTGSFGSSGDGGPALAASFTGPSALAIDSAGNVYVADVLASRVRKITPDGVINSVAGFRGETVSQLGIRGTETSLSGPSGLAVDQEDNLYIADKLNNRVLKLFPSNALVCVAGTGQRRPGGDGGLASETPLNLPSGLAVDFAHNLYVTESNRVRKVSPTGVIITIAGRGPVGFDGDGGPGPEAELNDPAALAVDGGGNVFFADRGNRRIRKLAPANLSDAGSR